MTVTPKSRSRAYIFLLLNTILWGFASPIIKHSISFTSPGLFLLYRYLIASLIFLPIFLIHFSKVKKTSVSWTQIILLSLLGTPLTLLPLFYGLSATSAIEASLLSSSSPIFTIIGGIIYLNERLNKKEWRGIILAILGTLILALEPALTGNFNLNNLSLKGNLLILASNVIWSTFLILSKKKHLDSTLLTFTSFAISIPFFLTINLVSGSSLTIHPAAIPGVFYMAICGSIIAFWAYQEGQKRIEASEAAIFTYLQPVFAIPLSILWLQETFTPLAITATLVIALGVYLAERR